jgi:hypothetical protein
MRQFEISIHQIKVNTDATDSTDTHGFGVSDSDISIFKIAVKHFCLLFIDAI